MKKRHLFLLTVLLLFGERTIAQAFQEKYVKTEAITINDGLSQGMINCIFQDHFGFMWFGTNDGLNRFDGYKFTVFRYDANDPNSISGNLITSITEDSKGRLWIGTGLSGLNLFLMDSESFIRFTNDSTNNSITNNRILSVQEDPAGAIWAGTSSGLNKIVIEQKKDAASVSDKDSPSAAFFKKNKVTFTHIYFDDDHSKECFLFYDETTNKTYFEPTFYIDKRGILWAYTTKGLYNIVTTGSASSTAVRMKQELYDLHPSAAGLQFVFNYLEDTVHHKLYLMKKGYMVIVDEKTNEITFHENSRPQFGFYRTQQIQNDGKIWSAGYESVIQYDLSTKVAHTLRPKVVDQIRMMNHANTIFQDRSGLIWIGTKGYGILKYNPQSERFHEMALPSIFWMTNISDSSLLVIAAGKIMMLKENADGKYELDTTFMTRLPKVEPFRRADLAVKKRKGDYFINSSKIYRVSEDLKNATVISGDYNGSFPLFIDKDDDLWFGGGSAFCHFDTESGVVKEYPYPIKKINLTPYKFLEYIYQENENEFWLGTVDGLFYFNRKNEKWKHYYNVPGDKNSLSIDLVFSIAPDPRYPEKYIWLGTNGGGLNCLNKETGRFIHFNETDGLPNQVVYGILNDKEGSLWISTNKGLSCFTPSYTKNDTTPYPVISGGTFKNFEEKDGLQSNEFNRYAFTKTDDNILFFGGVNGINYFRPDEIKNSTYIPNVMITDFRLSNNSVLFHSSGKSNSKEENLLSRPVYLTEEITLPFSENMFSFEFAAMDFTAPANNRFRYKLENFDKDWINSGEHHAATYTNLDPGHYTFTVIGSNNDGVWNTKGASVMLIILPPWYMTWWFRVALFVVVVGAVYILYRYRLNQALKLLHVRNSIASDLHDEIGSTLSSIYIYSEVAQRSTDGVAPEASSMMKNISTDVAGMIEALGDIVWTVNAKNDRFENIINRMRAAAVEIFEAQEYNLHIEMDDKLNTIKLGMEARRNFYLFYKEAINNIAKYAKGKNVWINLKYDKRNSISLFIKDDGTGFNINEKVDGNGLANMSKRAEELNGDFEIISAPGSGTEIHLEFSYS